MDASAARRFARKNHWLTLPSLVISVVTTALAVGFAAVTFTFPPGRELLVWGLAIGVGTASLLLRLGHDQIELRTLGRVGSGELPPTREHLSQAIREVQSAPGRALLSTLAGWLIVPVIVGIIVKANAPEVGWSFVLSLAGLGVVFAPLSAALVYLHYTLRGRQLVTGLADLGLTADEVIRVLPPARWSLRARFVLLLTFCFWTPASVSAFASITLTHERWARLALIVDPAERALQASRTSAQAGLTLLMISGATLIVAAVAARTIARALSQPLRAIAEEATRLASGQLTRPRAVPAEDEAWVVSTAFTQLLAYLVDLLTQLQRAGVRISGAGDKILASALTQEKGAVRQSSALDETSSTTDSLALAARDNAETARAVSGMAAKTLSAATAGQQHASAFLVSMQAVRRDNQAIATAVHELSSKVQQIGRIVEFIRGVADRSDLLAVNAELEGTRAGEIGLGFSLVAAELRRLAENVLTATQEIESLIEQIREETGSAVRATRVAVDATQVGTLLAEEISVGFQRVLELASRTSESVQAIEHATQQQQLGTGHLAEAMAHVLRVTQENSVATGQISTASSDLSGLAKDLASAVARFTLPGGPGGEPTA